jgi:hypothetical protein
MRYIFAHSTMHNCRVKLDECTIESFVVQLDACMSFEKVGEV